MQSINVDTQRQANGTHAQALVDFTLPVSLAQGQYRIVGNLFDDYASNGFAPGFYDRSEGNGGDDNALGIKFTLEQDARVSLNISSSGYFAPDGTRIAANNIGGRYPVIFAADRSLFVGGTTLDNGPSTAPWQFFQSTLHNGNSFTLKAGDYVFWNLQGVASQYTQTFDFNSRDFYMNFDLTFNIVLSSTISITAASANKAEGNAGATPFTFTVNRTGDLSGASSAAWAVSGSGVTAADFAGGALPTGTVSFAAGETSTTITVNVLGDSTIEPDEGFTVTLSTPSAGTTITTATATGTIHNDDVPGLIGTDGADTLNGTADNETIAGLGGNDSLLGGLGNDTLSGGGGDDTLVGGSGADSLVGGSGNDTVSYASDAAGVTLRLDLGSGTDGGGSTDNFTGIEGVIGSGFNDVITGMVGITNFIDAGAGNDVVFGGDGAETILGGLGNDTLSGGGGDDTLVGGSGADSLVGGSGNDTVSYASDAAGVTLRLDLGSGTDGRGGTDNFTGIEGVIGSGFNDVITGMVGITNFIDAGAGNDVVFGGDGAETILGGNGDDVILAGNVTLADIYALFVT
jgi:Ca2+-binding RTX toxin-like protein